jgi:hypothetical protein
MKQTRLFHARPNKDPRIAYLKEAARVSAEGYWGHALTEFERRAVEVQGEEVEEILRAECNRCGAHVHVRPSAKGGRPSPPPIKGSAVSRMCDSPVD